MFYSGMANRTFERRIRPLNADGDAAVQRPYQPGFNGLVNNFDQSTQLFLICRVITSTI